MSSLMCCTALYFFVFQPFQQKFPEKIFAFLYICILSVFNSELVSLTSPPIFFAIFFHSFFFIPRPIAQITNFFSFFFIPRISLSLSSSSLSSSTTSSSSHSSFPPVPYPSSLFNNSSFSVASSFSPS